jgi:hypothetical protein
MGWPMSQDYNEAVQSPATHFADPDLRQGRAAANALGLPMPCSGNFADVYHLSCPGGEWAVKCFTRQVPGLRERYAAISEHLQRAGPAFMVDFEYLPDGIRVGGQWYPVVKMRWVEGRLLNEFVRDNLDKRAALEVLGQIWAYMGRRLREAGIAHGDLQHGNVLLVPATRGEPAQVKLIDYDGMYIPALAGIRSGEVGHPNYQHPQRLREGTYSPEVDRFPLLVVAVALRCLRVAGRPLWERYDNGDNLLFQAADFADPHGSPLFAELLRLPDTEARSLAARLMAACQKPLEQTPLLGDICPEECPATVVAAPETAPQAEEPAPPLAPVSAAREESWRQPPPRRATYDMPPPVRRAPAGAPPPPVGRAPAPAPLPVPPEPDALPAPGPPIHLPPWAPPPPMRRAAAPDTIPTPAPPAPTSRDWKPDRRVKFAVVLVLLGVCLAAVLTVVLLIWVLWKGGHDKASTKPDPKPGQVARWFFERDAKDSIGTLHGSLKGGAVVANGRLELKGEGSRMEAGPLPQDITERTLEAWVRLADLAQRGRVIMSIWRDDPHCWDGILYAESRPRRWYPGSSYNHRSRDLDGPEEDARPGQPVHLVAVYARDNSVTLYRDGEVYGAPFVPRSEAPTLQIYPKQSSRIILGNESRSFLGEVEEASLNARALTKEEVVDLFREGWLKRNAPRAR